MSSRQFSHAEVRSLKSGILPPPVIPVLDPLLEDCEMFRVRHGRVTSLASALLPMILEGHTLPAPQLAVNVREYRAASPRPPTPDECGTQDTTMLRNHSDDNALRSDFNRRSASSIFLR